MQCLRETFDRFEAEGAVFGSINKKDFHNIPCMIPPHELITKFEEAASPLDQLVECNEKKSDNLAAIRDTLLPKLISGDLRVKGVMKIVGYSQ